jgi:outer membrane receptor protein involved in Fe transport
MTHSKPPCAYTGNRFFRGLLRWTACEIFSYAKPVGTGAFALAVGIAAVSLGGHAALAQQAPQNAPAQGSGQLEEVTVTGSRIIRSGMTTPTPVTAVQATELQNMSPGTLLDSLSQLPQFFNNQTAQQVNGGQNSGGLNLNLRGAGTNRTLVLLDGRRVTPSNRFGTVDVGVFPKELISSVETVTGGASASYGSDAVAGVVNFRLNTSFTGLRGNAQAGISEYGDGQNFKAGMAFGTDLSDKVHLLASAEVYGLAPIDSFKSLSDRKYYQQWARITNPNYDPADPNSGPKQLLRPYVSPTNYSNTGIIDAPGTPLDKLTFTPDGREAVPLVFSGLGQLNGGCNCQSLPYQTYGVDKDNDVATGLDRANSFFYIDYDATPNLNLYAQVLYGYTKVTDRRESIAFNAATWQERIYVDNAFLPQQVVDLMKANNLEWVKYGFFALNEPNTPIGASTQYTINNLYQGTLGFKHTVDNGGRFMSGWHIDGYYQHGQNNQSFDEENGVRTDRTPLAFDAVRSDPNDPTSPIVCRVALFDPQHFGDCVPMDIFGGVQNVSEAAAGYIMDDYKHAIQKTKQDVAEVLLTGDIWKGRGAGPISGAFGASYRRETLAQRTTDPTDEYPALPNGTLLSDIGLLPAGLRGLCAEGDSCGTPGYNGIAGLRFVPPGWHGDSASSTIEYSSLRTISGGDDVKEAFGELNLPVLADKKLAQDLTFSTAARYADYSGSGGIWAWKFGADWQMTKPVRFRATRSRDIRAATLRERFDQTRSGLNVQDPVFGGVSVSAASLFGGNEHVAPEKADTTTIGAVFQPGFAQNFQASVDWYHIDIKDAIGLLSAQDIVDGCFQGDQSLCQYVHRDATDHLDRVDRLFINLNKQLISGVDMELSYRWNRLTWRFFGSYLAHNIIQTPGGTKNEQAGDIGQYGMPQRKFTTNLTYNRGPFSLFVQERWLSGGKYNNKYVEGVDIDNNHVPSAYYTDLHLGYEWGPTQGWSVYGDISNLFDQPPRRTPQLMGRTGTNEFRTDLYDVVGRRFAVGLRFRF